ncbi:MAG: malto-oligosyltrehalose synthase [Acidimicrobiales bacterium]
MTPQGLGSTYRLDLRAVGLRGATALVPYLSGLGVQTLYVSPLGQAAPGSTHGYDVVDPTVLDPALGTPEDLEALLCSLDTSGMGLLVDIVPNHMAAAEANRWWWGVLREGAASPWASFFDIDWEMGEGKVVLARLGEPLASVVEKGVELVQGETLVVGGVRLPLASWGKGAALEPGVVAPEVAAELLGSQHYRAAYWRVARFEGNYRRFFDVDALVALVMEAPGVYRATHPFVLALAADHRVKGLRVDHVDGLADPFGYLSALRADAQQRDDGGPVVLVEKILGQNEELPGAWPVAGTTGYELADLAVRLLIDPSGAARLEAFSSQMAGGARGFSSIALAGRSDALRELFPGALSRLAEVAARGLDEVAPGHDICAQDLLAAFDALISHLDVYRTYLGTPGPRATNRPLARAAAAARAGLDTQGRRALRGLCDLLVGRVGLEGADAPSRTELVRRFEQLSGDVAAKGVEDTALYRWHGLAALADVGSDPGRPPIDCAELHRELARRRKKTPGGLNTLSTHDSKRSADVRARLCALSEDARHVERVVKRWASRHAGMLGSRAPSWTDMFGYYENLIGIWPFEPPSPAQRKELARRLGDASCKAAREAKLRTSWLEPDPSYEALLTELCAVSIGNEQTRAELGMLLRRIGPAALTNSLSMVVLSMTAPGVPDVYQGGEVMSLSLVDPDNRRRVDFDDLGAKLALADEHPSISAVTTAMGCWQSGIIKLLVTRALLKTRRDRASLFATGSYRALSVRGSLSDHVVAFVRADRSDWVLSVIPRMTMTLAGPGKLALGQRAWGDTEIVLGTRAPRSVVDKITGERHRLGATVGVADLLGVAPVSVLLGA